MAGAGHGFSILQRSSRSCSSPACCQQLGSHPRIRGWGRESRGAAGAAMSGRSCVTAQAPAHPAPSQKAPLPGSSPQHMVNTLLIIMAVNSTSLLPEPRLALARGRSRLGWRSAAPTHSGLLRSPVPCPGCPCPSEQPSPPVGHLPTAPQHWHR